VIFASKVKDQNVKQNITKPEINYNTKIITNKIKILNPPSPSPFPIPLPHPPSPMGMGKGDGEGGWGRGMEKGRGRILKFCKNFWKPNLSTIKNNKNRMRFSL